MKETVKKYLWSGICTLWALIISLFWFAMRVIWSGISKVVSEAVGEKSPSDFMLNLPLIISIFLWIVLALALANAVFLNHKKWPKITLTSLLGVFTIASIVVVALGAIDYLYFILPKFFISLLISLCIGAFAAILFLPPIENTKLVIALKCSCVALVILVSGYLQVRLEFHR